MRWRAARRRGAVAVGSVAAAGIIVLTSARPAWAQMARLDGRELQVPPVSSGQPHTVRLQDILRLRDMRGLWVSPNGRYAATLVNQPDVEADSYRFAWFVVDLTVGGARNVGDAGEPSYFDSSFRLDRSRGTSLTATARWSPDSRRIAYLSLRGGIVQIMSSDVESGRQAAVTRGGADVIAFVWSANGRRIVYATGPDRDEVLAARAAAARNGYLVTPATDWSFRAQAPFQRSAGPPRYWSIEVSTGIRRPASPSEVAAYRQAPDDRDGAVPQGRRFEVAIGPAGSREDTANGPPVSMQVRRSGGGRSRGPILERSGYFEPTEIPGDGRALAWWSADGETLYSRRRVGLNKPGVLVEAWRPASSSVRTVRETADTLTSCNGMGARMLCLRQTPTSPRVVESIDLATGAATTLFDPNPEWRNVRLGETTWMRWSDGAGHETFGVLTKPVGYEPGRRYPLVLIGYATSDALRGDAAGRYPSHVLAAAGFVTLVYDHWRNPAVWHRKDALAARYQEPSAEGRVMFDQLAAAVDLLAARGLVDPDRVGVAGHSDGLNPIAYGLIHSDRFRAAATSWIRWNPSNYFMMADPYRAELEAAGLVRAPEQPPSELARQLSLALNVARVRAPILVSASDTEFAALNQAEALRRFGDLNRPLEMHVYPDEEHIFFHPAHRSSEARRNIAWFQFWLQGVEAGDPIDPEQFARWRRLKGRLGELRSAGSTAQP